MSSGQMPPWLQEQLMKLQQSQQNLQSVMTQKQHLEMEKVETEKALEELKKAGDGDNVYKHSGSILIKSTKKDLIDDLEERLEMAKTRSTVLEKQEARLKETLKEQETKITEMMKSGAGSSGTASSGAKMQQPSDDNPRK
ncbi:prefoldin subunit beta [Nitrosopumilus sp. K4]|uniref:prefoldin subunit beta n=1 Tax=Nitrosopumilus sp. K4 TaxID=2795383 RepID=UPI001BA65C50|nr:prefoldin subunit beta [Nitrosopumilus sp. K4]QUC64042.1 prefoldin subunit beta [Nitrosopumilus sp. K4]